MSFTTLREHAWVSNNRGRAAPTLPRLRVNGVKMASKILVVDDEAKIVKLVRSYLEQSGFAVVEAGDGQTALIQARREKPDLVILDLGLPGIDGLEVARILRREGNVPIIMLTARIEDTDKIVGLELGADDYV